MFALALRTLLAWRLSFSVAPVRAAGVELAWALLTGVLLVASVEFPVAMDASGPDTGWQLTLSHMARQGVRFGVETCYCYGPLYDLAINPYDPASFERKYLLELLIKSASAVLLLRLARQLTPGAGIALLGGMAAGMLILPMNQAYFLLAGLAGLIVPMLKEEFTLLDLIAVPVYLAALGLSKFTFFPFAVAGLGITTAVLWNHRSLRVSLVPLTLFSVATVLFWTVHSQRIRDLPAFLASSLHYTSAYTQGLSLEGPRIEVQLCLAILALLLVMVVRHWHASVFRVAGLALVGLTAVLGWKAGFVRQDSHVLLPFVLLLVLPTLLQRLTAATLRLPLLATLLAGVGVLEVAGRNQLGSVLHTSLSATWLSHWQQLTHPGDLQARLEQHRRDQQSQHDLPAIRNAVGSQTIDAFTECQGVALLNSLNLRPRPTVQSVNAMDAAMLTANAAYLAGDAAPAFVLVKWSSFDGRYPTLTDGPAVLQLLRNYELALVEKGYLLLRRRVPLVATTSELALDQTAAIDDVIELPNDKGAFRMLQLTITPTLFGQLRASVFRPPVVFLLVRTRDGVWHSHVVPPALAAAEFLLDPLCESAGDFETLFRGEAMSNVTAIKVHVMKKDRGRVAPVVRCQIRTLAR